MPRNKRRPDELPETFATFEEMAEFWDTHDIADYEQYLAPMDVTIAEQPKHEYVITLSDSLNTMLRKALQAEGVSLNTLMNLWVQEKLQQYVGGRQDQAAKPA